MPFSPALGTVGSALGGLAAYIFGPDPRKEGMPFLKHTGQDLKDIYSPYMKHGEQTFTPMQQQLSQLLSDPGSRLNQIGMGYKESPGFEFQKQQALQGAGHAAAAGGMAGTPMHQQQAMALAQNLASQDYNNWLKNALGLYGQGMKGSEDIYNIGAQMAGGLGGQIGQLGQSEAQLAAQAAQNKRQQLGGILGGLGSSLGFIGKG